jgi:hypothetical protein
MVRDDGTNQLSTKAQSSNQEPSSRTKTQKVGIAAFMAHHGEAIILRVTVVAEAIETLELELTLSIEL